MRGRKNPSRHAVVGRVRRNMSHSVVAHVVANGRSEHLLAHIRINAKAEVDIWVQGLIHVHRSCARYHALRA